ncbi:MAG: hypothetical protein D6736_04805 [Nitrospinota bacterium]|nr:MAG: hypothetical protein D6736_04805 [Nitrospinota bacterium]
MVEVPVKKEYAPNIFVSVLAVRGRVGDIQPTATIDLGRPAYRLGIAEIEVGWKAYALKVKVSTDRSVYQVREKVEVNIEVQTADGAPPPAGSEVAVAAVDEGLLELMPNTSWQVLRAMMRRRGYAVRTATAQMHVVGKRHFGLKALPVGGGGGKQVTRTLFDTLLFWKGRVPLDAQGKASIEMRLNDSLTSFRIVAIATGGLDRFGTGDTTIRTTQDLMLLSGIPPVMREGDRYWAALTLRNTTTRPMEITVTGSIEESQEELPEQVIRLAAGEGREIGWEVTVPAGVDALHYTVEAREKGGRSDRILVRQQVVPAVPVRTLQATITRLGEEMRMTIAPPREALPGRGGLQLLFRPRLADGLPGVTTYMQHYPYTCLEQQVSQAIALGDNARWDRLLAVLPTYLDADGLLKYFPSLWHGSEVLTAYVLAITHEAGWKLPAGIQRKMVSGLERFVEGKIRRYSLLPAADLPLRKLMAIEALSRLDPAQAHRVSSIPIQPDFWPTSALLDWLNILYRVPGIGERGRQMAAAEQILRSRLSLQGSTLRFSSADTDALWWLMVSPDTNAVRLILTLLEGRRWPDELPRLVRGVLTRQRRGAWDLTVANAWGVLALKRFSQAFEQTPVTGTTLVSLDHTVQQVDWEANPQGKAIRLPWPSEEAELSIRHRGTGSPWVTLQSLAALPLTRPLSNGFTVRKRLFPVQQQHPERWSRGDVVRIRLEITAQAEMTWVVVADPIPAGSTILGSGLAREAQFATAGEQERGRAWPTFTERSFEAFKAYYAYVPPGIWTVEYTIRLNTAGTFQLPPTRVEALYAPEMFGESPNPEMRVQR